MYHLQLTIYIYKSLDTSENLNFVIELELTAEHLHFKICI